MKFTNVAALKSFSDIFKNAKPFEHVVIDGAFDPILLTEAVRSLGEIEKLKTWKYDNYFEKKLAFNDVKEMPPLFNELIAEIHSPEFIKYLEDLSGFKGLIPDPELNGGGLHLIPTGGKLKVHVDYNLHPKTKLLRKLNFILYLNENWLEEYGGHLELWNNDMSNCDKKIAPIFNRLVLFHSNDKSYHGHPHELKTPPGIYRKSLALYFYVNPDKEIESHSTLYQKEPGETYTEDVEELRKQRAKSRVDNK